MTKRFIFAVLAFTVVVLIAGLFVVRVVRRNQRQAAYEAAKNAKANQIKITTIEGWNVNEIGEYLEKQDLVRQQDFLSAESLFNTSNYPLLSSKPKNQDLEGFLFPDTYFVLKSATPFDKANADGIIKKMLDNFATKFTPAMEAQAQQNNMTVYQTLVLASIVENETGRNTITTEQRQKLDEQRKIIAGIFYNRLSVSMPLESDATVNYVTKKNDPSVTIEDTQVDSLYNTYRHPGLPPGPISNPSLSSIMAVLYPTKTDYYYFLHKQPSGEPVYGRTLQEHNQNRAKYLP